MRALVLILLATASGCAFERAGTAGDDNEFIATADTSVPPTDTYVELDDTFSPDTELAETADTKPADGSTCNESVCGKLPTTTTKRVALVDRSVACPPGFKSTDLLEAKDGMACSCSCNLNAAPVCPGAGALTTATSMDCTTAGPTLGSAGSNLCSTIVGGAAIANGFKATAPPPLGGACGAMPKTDTTAVTRQRRLCEPNAGTCAAPICAGSPFLECIEHAGACPAEFPSPRVVGTSASVTCPSCTCTMSATCTGKISFFATACTGTATTFAVDGTCNMVTGGPGTYPNFKYVPNAPTAAICNASFASAPGTRTVLGQRNLCCK